jgi:hypothetical protein
VVAWAAGLPLEWFRTRSDAEAVVGVLEIVGRKATVREVHAWTRRQMEMAAEWAVSEHWRRQHGGSAPPIPSHVARLPEEGGPYDRPCGVCKAPQRDWCVCGLPGACVLCADDPRGCGVGRGAGCPAVGIPPLCPCELCTEARADAARAEERGAIPPPPKVPTEPTACAIGERCATCARLNGSAPAPDEPWECAVCGVDETLSDTLSTVNVSARCLCAECADEEARAVIAAAERDPDHARLVNEARATPGRWAELLVSCGFLDDDSGPISTACVVTRLATDLEQRRADRRDLGALVRLLGPSDAVARSSNALARGETMEQAWATWSLDDRQLLSDVLKLDVSTASWELVRGVL